MLPEAFMQFHFLRPEWLAGLIALPLLWLVMNARTKTSNDWNKAIDSELLKHLTPSAELKRKSSSRLSLLVALCFAVLAMAGPTWEEKPQPVVQVSDNMVVILDLSISMLSTDTAPDRLTRAKHKLQDLLALRKEGNTALIAFSGDSHVVTPLTDDTKTLLANLPALDPFMMPVIGSRPDIAIEQAIQLLEQGGATKGRVILITDGVEPHQQARISELLEDKKISLNILAAGTKNGAPIKLPDRGYLKDGDQVVIPKTNFSLLGTLATDNQGNMVPISLDDNDLDVLDISGEKLIQAAQDASKEGLDKRFDTWEDMGYIFLLIALPFALIAYRQSAFLVVLLLVMPTEQSYAFEWADLWQTPDQRAQTLMNQGQYEAAADLFDSPDHKAYAQYQANQFDQAELSLSQQLADQDAAQQNSITSQYNLGNALAKQQKLEEALAAYNDVLEAAPNHEDAAFNKQLIKQLLQQQNQEQSESENSDESNENQENQDNQDQSDQNQDQQNSDQQNTDQQNTDEQKSDQQDAQQNDQQEQSNEQQQSEDESQNQEQQSEQEQSEQQQSASESDKEQQEQTEAMAPQAAEELSEEEKQSFEQWMRRVPDDPAGLLRRKFEQQARERNRTERQQGEPLW